MPTSTRASRPSYRTALRRGLAVGGALTLIITSVAMAATATLSIDSIGGQTPSKGKVQQPLSGAVTVSGHASLEDAGAPPTETTPLVADAGDNSAAQPSIGSRASMGRHPAAEAEHTRGMNS